MHPKTSSTLHPHFCQKLWRIEKKRKALKKKNHATPYRPLLFRFSFSVSFCDLFPPVSLSFYPPNVSQPYSYTDRRTHRSRHWKAFEGQPTQTLDGLYSFQCSLSLWMTEFKYFMDFVSLLYKILKSYLRKYGGVLEWDGGGGIGVMLQMFQQMIYSVQTVYVLYVKTRLAVTLLELIVLPVFFFLAPFSNNFLLFWKLCWIYSGYFLMSIFAILFSFIWKSICRIQRPLATRCVYFYNLFIILFYSIFLSFYSSSSFNLFSRDYLWTKTG